MAYFDRFQHLKIQLEDIKFATNNFDANNVIGKGGFGKVYKGEISHSKGRCMAAFKRLDPTFGQGIPEFLKEITMLSRYRHENLVSLLGYCDEGGEKILVYEHASRGSLDHHLRATTLTWRQRLRICIMAAEGLCYLHDHTGTHQRVIHRDIKSANILLDENWNAKVSDLGLSKIGPANQQHTVLVTNIGGTPGYIDPLYMETYMLTKESDVYSFGVVLFEVLCGRLCFEYINGQWKIFVTTWKESYENKKLAEIISKELMQQMDSNSLEAFSNIAYQCLKRSREERPTMALVVGKLQTALELQEMYEEMEQHYGDVIMTAVPALIYRSKEELKRLLAKGVLVNHGKTWFSLNKNRHCCEMISAAECSIPILNAYDGNLYPYVKSRFAKVGFLENDQMRVKAHIRARFLSPEITYTVNLVFKLNFEPEKLGKQRFLALKYKLKGENKYSVSYLAHAREDGWLIAELYQFTSNNKSFEVEIWFKGIECHECLIVEGIEFSPLEKVSLQKHLEKMKQNEALEGEKMDLQPLSDSDTDWEQNLPNDYKEIIKWSKDSMEWTTKKELYFLFCKGFRINNGEEWFYLAKNGKKCRILSARACLVDQHWRWTPLPESESRFEEVASDPFGGFRILWRIKSQVSSTYACYLVYKILKNHSDFERPVRVNLINSRMDEFWFIYLVSPQIPVIRPNTDQNTHNPSSIPNIKGLPRLRDDGWMEVQVFKFQAGNTTQNISLHFEFSTKIKRPVRGLIVQGIEFKAL